MVEGTDELMQSIERTLTTNIEEWFLNIEFGLDFKAIRDKGKDLESIKLTIMEAIYQDDRVESVEITEIKVTKDRVLKVYGIVTDVEGNQIYIEDLGEVVEIE